MRMLHADPKKKCGICRSRDTLELHHIYPRSQGGDDVRANLMFLCRGCHRGVTLNEEFARQQLGICLEEFRPDTLAYLAEKGATGWAERQLFIDISWLRSRES